MMIDYVNQIIADQFDASLCTLNQCVSICPTEHWTGLIGKYEFWHVAYHTLHYVDLYLSPDEKSFEPPPFHRPNTAFFGKLPWPPHEEVSTAEPYEKSVIIDYVAICRRKASHTIASETQDSLKKPSGFPWYSMSRGEHHLCSIRHVQHHAGQMCAYLRKHTDLEFDWIGKA